MTSLKNVSASEQIASVNKELEEAMRDGSASRLTAIYSSDGQLLPPNEKSISGVENIYEYWTKVIESGITSADLVTLELDLLESTAIEVGSYVMKKGQEVEDEGKYLIVWKYENNEWKYHKDIWNSDLAS